MRKTLAFPVWPALGLGAYALLYFSLIYHPGLIRMDDFGYLQGVVDTLAQGRLRTGEWLQPYSATLSGLCALAYLATGNFPFSTWGLQAVFVCANFLLIFRLLRSAMGSKESACLALALASQPVYWHKCSEFSGNVFSLAFAMLALLAYLKGNRMGFFLAAFLAFANRQNNIALLALPGFHLVAGGWPRSSARGKDGGEGSETDRVARIGIGAGLAAFLLGASLLHTRMNHTVAQAFGIVPQASLGAFINLVRICLIGVFACLACLSALGMLTGDSPLGNLRVNLRRPLAPGLLTLVFAALPLIGPVQLLSFLTPLVGSLDRGFQLQWLLLVLIPALLWVLDYGQLHLDAPAWLVLGLIAASGLRGFWYDFYLVDPIVATIFYRLTRAKPLGMGRPAYAIAALLLAGHVAWGYAYKIECDKQMLAISAYERLERAGTISVAEMSGASFGYLGWKLFDHYYRHGNVTGPEAFLCYLRLDRVVVQSELPWRKGFPPDARAIKVLEAGDMPIGFRDLRYRVVDLQMPDTRGYCSVQPTPLDTAVYKPKPYPLDAREWSAYIAAAKAGADRTGGR